LGAPEERAAMIWSLELKAVLWSWLECALKLFHSRGLLGLQLMKGQPLMWEMGP